MKSQSIVCPLCSGSATNEGLESHVDSETRYILYECPACSAQWWEPLKNPGAEWYEKDERYAGANENPSLEPNWNHRKAISYFGEKSGRVLDIGCGTGNFLSWAKKKGWDVYGIDFDRNAVRAATDVFRLPNISVATLAEFVETHPELMGGFDLVTFFDVFEHIDDHNEFAVQISRLVKPNGHIAMSMPYRGGSRWLQPNDLPPRHLTRWDRGSLAGFWGRHRFNVRYIKRVPSSLDAILMKFRFRYGKVFSFGLVQKTLKYTQTQEPGKHNIQKGNTGRNARVRIVHVLAKTKDALLFGIPAVLVWLTLLPSKRRYTGLFFIAQKSPISASL